MQYITQCSSTRDVITTSLPTNNYLLSQIVKEQPIDAVLKKKHQSTSHPRDADCCFLDFPFRLAPSTCISGGANRDRTGDLLLAKQALSQLSYGPSGFFGWMVGLDGFEPSTPALSRRCSNQLSYRP